MCAKKSDLNIFESERMNRRMALKRLGITAGMAVFSLLSVDDLARIAAKKMAENHICENLANEFKSAGVAIAQDVWGCHNASYCQDCCDNGHVNCNRACRCDPTLCDCAGGTWGCEDYNGCLTTCGTNYRRCYLNCPPE